MRSTQIGPRVAARTFYRGDGYFAGEPPDDPGDLDSPDGRARILNIPTKVKIVVYERGMVAVAETRSAVDGTWRVELLDPSLYYTVIGFDSSGNANAAIQDWVKPALMV